MVSVEDSMKTTVLLGLILNQSNHETWLRCAYYHPGDSLGLHSAAAISTGTQSSLGRRGFLQLTAPNRIL